MNRSVPVVLLKMLINWYDKCAMFVRWNNVLSRRFYLMCGARQGGVSSLLLFSVRGKQDHLLISGCGVPVP